MSIFLYECKKILMHKGNLIALLLFTILSMFAYHALVDEKLDNTFQFDFQYEDGSLIARKDQIHIRSETKQAWKGVMDDAWWNRLEKANKEAEKRWDSHIIDFSKMEATYGVDWYEDYKAHSDRYGNPEYDDMDGKQELYYREDTRTYGKQDIIDMTVMDIYQYGKTMIVKQPWNHEDGTDGFMISMFDNTKVPSPVYAYDVSKEEVLLLKQKMNEKENFRYGDSKHLDVLFTALSLMGILLMFWVVLISGNMINKERRRGMLETLSTCKKGKGRLFLSKLLAVICCAMLGSFVMASALVLYAALCDGIGDLSVNATESVNLISIVTYGEGLVTTFAMMSLGIVIIATIGVFFSTFFRSSYISMAILLVFCFMSGYGWMGTFHNLMPDAMLDADRAINCFTISLFDHVWYLTDIRLLIWIPLLTLLGFIAWKRYTSKTYPRI